MPLSNYEKFKLLMWKNWIIDLNNRLLFIIELTLPVACCTLAVLIRIFVPKENKDTIIYNQTFGLDNLNLFKDIISGTVAEQSLKYELAYSPDSNKFFEKIITEAAASLKLRHRGYPNSRALEDGVQNNQIFAGVDFYDKMASVNEFPQKFAYSIRFPSELRTAFSKIQPWCTHLHFLQGDPDGPRNRDDLDGGIPSGYLREGFLAVQNAVSTTFIKQTSNTTELPSIVLQRFPYAHYLEDPLTPAIAIFLGLIMLQSYAYLCTYTIRCVTLEKEKRLKEVMKIMGISTWIHWIAWFAKSFMMMGTSSFFIAFVLTNEWYKGVAVLEKSSFSALLFFLIIYTIASIMFCFMTATFFDRANTAVAVTGLIWVMTFVPFVYFRLHYFKVDLKVKLLFAIFTNTAMGLGVHVIASFEHKGEGLQWRNFFTEVSIDDGLSMAHIICIMILSSVLFMTICLYVEQIYPGEIGVPQPWTFPLRTEFWFNRNSFIAENRRSSKITRFDTSHFESEPLDKLCGIQVRYLTKMYLKKVAVNNLTIDLYEDEITVLLGTTGSGKTVTVEMLAGMISPTSGTAYINGCDITQNLKGAHENMSICMEYNILFDDLTVRDNMVFFSRLKGMTGEALEDDIDRLIISMGLEEVQFVVTSSLSCSMQRKLSVCTAFCGSPKVVLCDDPSEGMDPAARLELWNFLCSEKIGRTILVTTHTVEEADALGDRIAVLGSGFLKCMGTPMYLKKDFGRGYRLSCTKGENFDVDRISLFLHKYIPNIEPAANYETEIVYQLNNKNKELYSTLLKELETNAQALSITGFSISMTSLKDVLIAVNADQAPESDESDSSVNFELFNRRLLKNKTSLASLKWLDLWFSQWNGMLLKKHLEKLSNMGIITIQTLMPVVCVLLTMFVSTGHTDIIQTPFKFKLTNYPSTVTILDSFDPNSGPFEVTVAENYRHIVNSYAPDHLLEETNQESFISYLLNRAQTIQDIINRKYIVGVSIRKSEIVAWMNNKPLHSAPLSVNLIHNAIAKTLLGPSVNIEVTNAPVPYSIEAALRHSSDDKMGSELGMNLSLCMSFVCTLYCVFLIKERTGGAKLLQTISGIRPLTFWSANFTWDMITFTAAVIVLLLVLGFFQIKGFNSLGDLARTCVILLLFGWAALPLVYFFSIFFTEPSVGYARITLLCIFIGFILFAFLLLTKGYDVEFRAQIKVDEFEKLGRFSPFYQMACGVRNLHANSRIRQLCGPLMKKHILQDRCRIYPQCCEMTSFFSRKTPGVGKEVEYLCISGTIFFTLIICVEHLKGAVFRFRRIEPKSDDIDEDVLLERRHVESMGKRRQFEHNLVVDKLTKRRRNHLIINNISFAVKPAECFGMVGAKGAGKSTVIKILVGGSKLSSGRVFIQGKNMLRKKTEALKHIGYCPEKDGLFDDFTGKETLRIYGLIHGIRVEKLNKVATYLAEAFGFVQYLNRQVKFYSECNKKRLCIALAIMCKPLVLYIDKPSYGMGPIAQLRLWQMIRNLRNSGMTIVIGSHRLKECKAICDRLAIMVNGEFKCFGTLKHLELKFGTGYILKIKISRKPGDPHSLLLSDSQRIQNFIQNTFSTAVLQDNALALLKYYFPKQPMLWSSIFNKLEQNKEKLKIEAYSLDQMTLEEVFLDRTKNQEGGMRVFHPSHLDQILTTLAYM